MTCGFAEHTPGSFFKRSRSRMDDTLPCCFTSTETVRTIIRDAEASEFQARSKDQEILEEGGGAGPSTSPEEIMSREVELG